MNMMAEPGIDLPGHVREELSRTADPGFASRLRSELRARQARVTRSLSWFDLELPVGPIRLVHDGELIHLVTNDLRRFDALADEGLGFEPGFGDSKRVREAVSAVLAGRRRGSEVAFLGALPPFQREVLRVTATIPKGQMRPYNWVARHAGSPGAVRAAGTALGHNPVPFVVPCHRVVRSDWTLGEYSAGGTEVKEKVLRAEGVTHERLEWLQRAPRYIGQLQSHEFCLSACPGLDEEDPATHRAFRSPEEALAEGYLPCDVCRPV